MALEEIEDEMRWLTVEVGAGEGLDDGKAEEEVSRGDPTFGDNISISRSLLNYHGFVSILFRDKEMLTLSVRGSPQVHLRR